MKERLPISREILRQKSICLIFAKSHVRIHYALANAGMNVHLLTTNFLRFHGRQTKIYAPYGYPHQNKRQSHKRLSFVFYQFLFFFPLVRLIVSKNELKKRKIQVCLTFSNHMGAAHATCNLNFPLILGNS